MTGETKCYRGIPYTDADRVWPPVLWFDGRVPAVAAKIRRGIECGNFPPGTEVVAIDISNPPSEKWYAIVRMKPGVDEWHRFLLGERCDNGQ